jgi:uncharacterized protein involved in exopolysaccharide biosynthesis
MKKANLKFQNKEPGYIEGEGAPSILEVLLILAHQIKIIILTPLIFCIIMIIHVTFIAKPTYTSISKMMSSHTGGRFSQAQGLAAQFGFSMSNTAETKWAYPEIIRSRTLAKAMLKRKFDTNKFGMQKSLLQILTYGNNKPTSSDGTLEIKGVDNFLKLVHVSEDLKTGIMTLKINSFEQVLSYELNRSLLQELDAHQNKYNKAKTSEAKKFIQDRIKDVEVELNAAEENLKVFMDRNRRIENSPALLLEQQRHGREVTVLTGVFTTLKQQLETTKIEEVKDSDYVVILDEPEIPIMRSTPVKKRSVLFAGLFGIGFGLVFAFVKEKFNNQSNQEKKDISNLIILFKNNILDLFLLKRNN